MQRQDSARPCKSSDRDGEPAGTGSMPVSGSVSVESALARPADDERFYTASVYFLRRRLQEKSDPTRGGGGGAGGAGGGASVSCCNLGVGGGGGGERGGARRQSVAQFCLDTPKLHSVALPMYQVLPFPKSNKDSFLSKIRKKFRKLREQLDEDEAAAAPAPATDDDAEQISNFKFPRCSRPAAAGPAAAAALGPPPAPHLRRTQARRPRRALGGISEEDSSTDAYSDEC